MRLPPFGIRLEGSPGRISDRAVLVRQQVDQRVALGDRLPVADDGHAMLLEQRGRVVSKPRVQEIEGATLPYRVGPQLEAAGIPGHVLDVSRKIRAARRRGRR